MSISALFRVCGSSSACILILAGLAAAETAESATPSQNVSLEMSKLANGIAKFLKGEGRDAITVGTFADRSKVPSNAGPGLARLLSEALKKEGVQIKDNAGMEVGGEYFTDVDAKEDRQAVYVRAILRDDKKNEVQRFADTVKGRKVLGAKAIASMLALTVDNLPPDEKDQDAKIRLAIAKPSDHIKGAFIAPRADSLYAIEILVKQGDKYVPRPAESKDGRAFVPLKKDETYAVRIINNSPNDAAVTLSIDGLSLFAFSDEKDAYAHVLVPANKSGLIKGWYRNKKKADAFTITRYADSAAAKSLLGVSNVGTITATFAVAWKDKPPEDEGSRSADIATGRGPEIDVNFTSEERHFGRTRTSISVRYAR